MCLESHKPIHLVIIMLGTNDVKVRFSAPAADIAKGVGLLLDIVSRSTAGPGESGPACLLVCPPLVGEEPGFDGSFSQGREKSKQLADFYKREVDSRKGCFFLDAAEYIETNPVNGVHLTLEGLAVLGRVIAEKIQTIPLFLEEREI